MDGWAVISGGLVCGRLKTVMIEKISIAVIVDDPQISIDILDNITIDINIY
jgi:hypothetical protein